MRYVVLVEQTITYHLSFLLLISIGEYTLFKICQGYMVHNLLTGYCSYAEA
jgi:hypothetical protein